MVGQDQAKAKAGKPLGETVQRKSPVSRAPGLMGVAVAGGFGLAAAVLAIGLSGAIDNGPEVKAGAVRLSPVSAADLEAALLTIAPEQREQIREEVQKCKTALFMMDIGPIPAAKDPASGFVQLRVGNYVSPRFAVGNSVTAFAIPHPISDAKTVVEGAVTVMGSARSTRVSFTPPVDYPVLSGSVIQPVYYDLPQACGVDTGAP